MSRKEFLDRIYKIHKMERKWSRGFWWWHRFAAARAAVSCNPHRLGRVREFKKFRVQTSVCCGQNAN